MTRWEGLLGAWRAAQAPANESPGARGGRLAAVAARDFVAAHYGAAVADDALAAAAGLARAGALAPGGAAAVVLVIGRAAGQRKAGR